MKKINIKQMKLAGLVIATSLFSPLTQASNIFPEDVFVSLKESGEIAKYPGQKVWKGDPVMLYNSITPDGKRLVVSSPKMRNVYVYDTQSHKLLAKVKVGKASKGLKISPNGKEVYVANEGEATVSVVNLNSYKNVATIKTKEKPHNIRFSNDGKIAYVTLQGGAGLGLINTSTRKMEKVIPVPGIIGPHNLDISDNEKLAFVRDTAGSVAVLDLNSEKVLKVIAVGKGHAGIDFSGDGKWIFTGAIADDIVSVIDPDSFKVIKNIKVGFGPHGVRTSKDGRWLYVVVTADNKMVVIDTHSLEVKKTFDIADFPFWVAVKGNP